jgi:hypothetical protein
MIYVRLSWSMYKVNGITSLFFSEGIKTQIYLYINLQKHEIKIWLWIVFYNYTAKLLL